MKIWLVIVDKFCKLIGKLPTHTRDVPIEYIFGSDSSIIEYLPHIDLGTILLFILMLIKYVSDTMN